MIHNIKNNELLCLKHLLWNLAIKTLLIVGQIGMGFWLFALAILAIQDVSIGIKIFTLLFLVFFEISIGPIAWLYNAEIMTEFGMTTASLIVWVITIFIGLFTNKLFEVLHPEGMYFAFTAIDIVGLLFIIFILKETKGLTKEELSYLYAKKPKLEDDLKV